MERRPGPPPTRTPIGDYAIVGDCRSAALVSRGGSIDWLCWPRFASPTVFGALLDPDAGRFSVTPAAPARATRRYLPGTNVLETTFESDAGVVVLTDLMPVGSDEGGPLAMPEHEILRLARCEAGEVDLEVEYAPRPGFGRWKLRWRDTGPLGVRVEAGAHLLVFRSEPRLPLAPAGGVRGRLRLRAGETARFSVVHAVDGPAVLPPLAQWGTRAADRTAAFWRRWSSRLRYRGPYRDAVLRSALALRLLAYAPSGAIVAAPTSSLPERLGGPLNWDYRFCWLRDASFTVRALFGLGYADEAEEFVGWLLHTTRLTRPELRVLYDLFGRGSPRERDLGWDGYCGSRPVRIGNGARDQLQLDVYGEVIDATAQFLHSGGALDRETGRMLAGFGDYVCRHWRLPDEGIWEPRWGRRQNTHSKALCWTALDRLLRLHDRGHLRIDVARFRRERDAIRAEIEARAWRPSLGSYSAELDGETLDAALLVLPWYGYAAARAPRMRATFARICERLGAGRGLLYRYDPSAAGGEGAFGVCCFWAAEYLALAGRHDAALSLLERLLGYANDVGLYAEEIDPATGAALGNFPQAFTHVGLVNAALTLERTAAHEHPLEHQRSLVAAGEAWREAPP